MNGAEQMGQMKAAGFNDDEIGAWRDKQVQTMSAAGFAQDEIGQYFGINANPDMSKPAAAIKANVDAHMAANVDASGNAKPLDFGQALEAGYGSSVTGLIQSQKVPTELSGNEPWYTRTAYSVGQMYGDLPAMIAGGVAGAPIGAAAGGLAGSVVPVAGTAVGAAVGSVAGAGAGAFAAPTYIREALIDGYRNGGFRNFGDFWDRYAPILINTAKSAMVGASTAGVGGKVAGAVAGTALPAVVKAGAVTASEVATVASMGKALDGQMPTLQDFTDAAILMGGFKAFAGGPKLLAGATSRLQDIFARTGAKPADIINDAQTFPSVAQDVASINIETPRVYASEAEPTTQPVAEAAKPVDETPAAPPEPGSTDEARAAILARIKAPDDDAEPFSTRRFYTNLIDQREPIRQVEKALGEGDAPAYDSAFKRMSLLPGLDSVFEGWMRHGPSMPDSPDAVGKSLESILAPHKGELDQLQAYWAAKQAVEMNDKGMATGFPIDQAKQLVAADAPRFDQTAQDLTAFAGHGVNLLRASGVLSSEGADAILAKWQSYAPMNRVMDDTGAFGLGGSIRNPIKARTGSEREVISPLASLVRNTQTAIQMGYKNQAVKSFYDMARKAEDPSQFFEEVPASLRPTTIGADEMDAFLKKQGIEDTPDELMTTFRAMRTPLGPDEVGFFDDGQWKVLKVDPDIADAFNKTATPMQGVLMSLARGVANLFRAGLVSPDFIVRHLIRNQVATATIAERSTIPFYDTFKGLVHVLGKDEVYQDWLKSGGGMGGEFSADRNDPWGIVQKLAGEDPAADFTDKVWNYAKGAAKSPLTLSHMVQMALEKGTRVGAFDRYMQGEEPTISNIMDAGLASRNVAPDPARIGKLTSTWNAITPLFNIELQHTDQLVQSLRDRPVATLTKIFAAVTVPSIALWYANQDNEAYLEAPQWERDMFWMLGVNGTTIRIAKPFLLGEVFGSGVEHLLDGLYGKEDGRAVKHYASDLFEHFIPNILPAVLRAPVEHLTNHSFYRDAPLVPDRLMDQLPELRYSDYTSETSKALGRLVGTLLPWEREPKANLASPMVIDNYVRQWTGAMGMYALSLADFALRKAGVVPDPIKPTATLADLPIIRSFVVRYPSAQADSIERFREDYAVSKMIQTSVQAQAANGDTGAVMRLMNANPTAFGRLDEINEALSKGARLVHLVNQNPDTPPDEKRQIIDQVYASMIEMAKAGNEANKQIRAALVTH